MIERKRDEEEDEAVVLLQEVTLFQELVSTIYNHNVLVGPYHCASTNFARKLNEYVWRLWLIFGRLYEPWGKANFDLELRNSSEFVLDVISLSEKIIELTKEATNGFTVLCSDIVSVLNFRKRKKWIKNRKQWIERNRISLNEIEEGIRQHKKEIWKQQDGLQSNERIHQLAFLFNKLRNKVDEQKMIAEVFLLEILRETTGNYREYVVRSTEVYCEIAKSMIVDIDYFEINDDDEMTYFVSSGVVENNSEELNGGEMCPLEKKMVKREPEVTSGLTQKKDPFTPDSSDSIERGRGDYTSFCSASLSPASVVLQDSMRQDKHLSKSSKNSFFIPVLLGGLFLFGIFSVPLIIVVLKKKKR